VVRATASTAISSELRKRAKLRLLRMHYEAGVGHIGGNLSAIDILLTLYHVSLKPDDAFILSKGHAAGGMYVTLWSLGRISEEQLLTFHKEGTTLSGHPPTRGIPEILFATGSLGHGTGLSNGLALAKKLKNQSGHVFCLTSDGEWNEGSSWESLIFARHHKLDNLTIIVDVNGMQGFGSTKEVADLEPIAAKFRAFDFKVIEIDGHDPVALAEAFDHRNDGPLVIVATTRKGCGVSFMENKMEWHYLPMNAELYARAVRDINEECA
jgi:transketolase